MPSNVRVRLDPRSAAAVSRLPVSFEKAFTRTAYTRFNAAGQLLAAGARGKLSQPTPGGRALHGGVREALMIGTTSTVLPPAGARGVAVRIRTTGALLAAGHKQMVGLYNQDGWRHPTFGHAPEVEQSGRWYFPKPETGRAVFDLAAAAALSETAIIMDKEIG